MAHGDASEFVELALGLKRASGTIGAEVAAALVKTAYDIQTDAQAFIVINETVDTGDLLNSVSTTVIGDGRFGRIEAEIGPTVDYGADVEYGTQPHDIPNAWGRGFTVHHPGTAPQPYMRPAFDRRAPTLEVAVDKIMGRALP